MPKPVNVDDMDWAENGNDGRFMARAKRLAMAAGGTDLGCSLYRLEPGKCAFPAHSHYGIEEAVFILRGTADLRYGDDLIALKAGDYFALPKATGKAHQMQNNGDGIVEYLCLSTMSDPDIVYYPDGNKIGVMAGFKGAKSGKDVALVEFYRREPVGYFDGED